MNKYGLHGKLNAKPGNGDALANLLLEAADKVSTAKGCLIYLISRDQLAADTIWITEVWDSKQDHDDSLKVEGIKEIIAKAMPILEMPEKGQEFTVVGGHGIAD